jgi:hypothetical protein
MAAIGIVIVNHNAGEHLARCVTSLPPSLVGQEWQAVVVDNASTDGSARAAREAGPQVTLVESGANVGFARAVNAGARHVGGEFLLLLNPDCRLEPGVVDALVAELDTHPACGVAAPSVVDEDGTPQGNARGDPSMLTGLFGRSSRLRRLLPGARVSRQNVVLPSTLPPGEVSVAVDWVAASCALIRRTAFDAVGGLDEGYFLYWEDADFCRRLRHAGWTTRFRPGVAVVHVGGQSAREAPALAAREFHRSAYRYYRTHVAPSPWDPRRWVARGLLWARYVGGSVSRALGGWG